MSGTETPPAKRPCSATTITGRSCKNVRKQGSTYCWLHSLSRTKDARWYENTLLQGFAGILATVIVGWWFFQLGPTKQKQEEGLTLLRTGLVEQAKQGTKIDKLTAPNDPPHVRTGLITGQTIKDRLEFTNTSLLFKGDATDIFREMMGVLLVPVTSPESDATLRFFAFNDSPAVDEAVTLNVIFPTNLVCIPSKSDPPARGWESLESFIPKFQAIGIKNSRSLLPFEQAMCPDLHFKNTDGWSLEGIPIMILVRGKGMEDSYVAFWLTCPSMTNPAPPQLRMGTRRSDGKMHLELDVDQESRIIR